MVLNEYLLVSVCMRYSIVTLPIIVHIYVCVIMPNLLPLHYNRFIFKYFVMATFLLLANETILNEPSPEIKKKAKEPHHILSCIFK